MYTRDDLVRDYNTIREKIDSTDITEETFAEIENLIRQDIMPKENVVYGQVLDLVKQANEMCKLHREICGTANGLWRKLKIKKLEAEGVDLSNSYNRLQKYGSYIDHYISWPETPSKVVIKKTYL